MAVVKSPNSKATEPAPIDKKIKKKTKNNKKKEMEMVSENNGEVEMKTETESDKPKPKKRNANPGVRVIHGKIYDSKNGTTCHQCRQKTYAEYVSCKNKAKAKPCPIKYCVTCLLNRYGEKAEEVSLLDQWDCPKCKDVCNCSICIVPQPQKKREGAEVTKDDTGVSDKALNKKKPKKLKSKSSKETIGGNVDNVELSNVNSVPQPQKKQEGVEVTKDDTAITNKALEKKPKKLKSKASKETIGGNVNNVELSKTNSVPQPQKKREGAEVTKDDTGVSDKALNKKKPKKLKSKSSKETIGGNVDNVELSNVNSVPQPQKKQEGVEVTKDDTAITNKALEKKPKKLKSKASKETIGGNVNNVELSKTNSVPQPQKKREGAEVTKDDTGVSDKALNEKKPKKLKSKASKETIEGNVNNVELSKVNEVKENTTSHEQDANQHLKHSQPKKVKKNDIDLLESIVPLPTGSDLVTIAGVDLSKEDAGNALQLLEFCSTFGKILNVKKGQAEAVLRDLFKGRSTRRGKCTSVIQFYIQLLSVIQEESDSESESESLELDPAKGNNSWLKVLKNCISKSQLKHLDCVDTTARGYDNLDSSTKLGLLIFLCDEVLGTEKVRSWIDDENTKFAEKKKEAREKLCAAKNKEKTLKQKMQDEIAKAIIANEGVPMTIKEHDSVVSKIKKKAAEAHAEMLECQKMGPQDKEKPDAVRIVPAFKDDKGHMYWRLKGCSDNPGILLQDIGTGDHMVGAADKWFGFDDEQIKVIERHFNILRLRFKKYYKNLGVCAV
ncbi:DDT domain, subgroup [Artemisia annua]|uniref:DDT domain, subgroup n=1 Tax=Artemisia annua TaxID=35608 RepID=A0A2U1PPC2_ARTAN|nr:DDT domain, subgroup [Artemisia annua]